MSKDLEFISDVYDVVQTVGLTLAGRGGEGAYVDFRLRAEVVRLRSGDEFTALLWHVRNDDNALLFLGHPEIAGIRAKTAEAVVEAVLQVLNSIGARSPAEIARRLQKPVPTDG